MSEWLGVEIVEKASNLWSHNDGLLRQPLGTRKLNPLKADWNISRTQRRITYMYSSVEMNMGSANEDQRMGSQRDSRQFIHKTFLIKQQPPVEI